MECVVLDMIHNYRIRRKFCAEYDTDNKTRSYFAGDSSAGHTKKQLDNIIGESMYHLKVNILGNQRLGLFSFIQLKQTIAQMKISSSLGIKACSKLFDMFQIYFL